ncbi:unnamed protein product, partial [Phaeothamnion confervicola]
SIWQQCLIQLERELTAQQFNTWIRPLQAIELEQGLEILAPNRFVLDWIRDKYGSRIRAILDQLAGASDLKVSMGIGSVAAAKPEP